MNVRNTYLFRLAEGFLQSKENDMPAFNNYKYVFTPLKAGAHTLKNRIEWSPMVSNMVTKNGEITQDYVDFVERQAKSGCALITIGATPVDRGLAREYDSEVNVSEDSMLSGLHRITEAAHIYGAKMSVELFHSGLGTDLRLHDYPYGIAPSNFPVEGQNQYIKVMDQHDIEQVIAAFVDAACRCQQAGFDFVMIHAAHGNLLGQFLSARTNQRNDMYGGSMENRFRFPLMVCRAVREAVGPEMGIEMRISGDEIVEGGMRIDETIEFIKRAQEYIDLVHVSAGLIVEYRAQFYTMPPYYREKGCNVKYARAVKECPDIHIPVVTVGGINTVDMAEQILAEGSADMIAMARGLLADPDMLNKAWAGHPEDARPCLRCWGCAETFGAYTRCAVNPQICRSRNYAQVQPARQKKKVVVVGGGVAGMMAANTLVQRGHDVVLFEKKDRLGGLLHDICNLDFKDDLKRYVNWNVRTTMNCGADIRLNTEATPKLVMAEKPDAIVVTTGSVPVQPAIPGIDNANVRSVLDVDKTHRELSGRVVVCGGGVSGCECALQLAYDGCDVTVVDMLPAEKFASGLSMITRTMLLMLLSDNHVKLIGDCKVKAIQKKGVKVEDRNWTETVLPADFVVDAFGMKSTRPEAEAYRELIPEVYILGDASEVKNIKKANFDTYNICCNI